MNISKEVLRKQLQVQLSHFTDTMEANAQICEKILNLPSWNRAGQIFAFIPFKTEPDISPVIDAAIAQGKEVLVPVCDDDCHMHFVRLSEGWREHLGPGLRKTCSPIGISEEREPIADQHPVMITPGVGFDMHGDRMGKGAGYYDRYISMWCKGVRKVGVCYDFQLLEDIPSNADDQRMDVVVTNRRVVLCG